jgi:hypothetical protein
MIAAQVKHIYTWSMDDLESHVPPDPGNFCIIVRAMVGPRGQDGEESFDINVCTPQWLTERVEREGFVLGMHHLFVAIFDPVEIRALIAKLMERYSGNSWREVADKLSRVGQWEFEGQIRSP